VERAVEVNLVSAKASAVSPYARETFTEKAETPKPLIKPESFEYFAILQGKMLKRRALKRYRGFVKF